MPGRRGKHFDSDSCNSSLQSKLGQQVWRVMSKIIAVSLAFAACALSASGEKGPFRVFGGDVQEFPGLVPFRCGTDQTSDASLALPAATRMWETVPGVIRNDGIDTFRLEVNVNGRVNQVSLTLWPPVLAQSGQGTINLRDDGLQGDRKASDFIYTSEPLRFDTNQWSAPYYAGDTNSPAGLIIKDVGPITVTETNGQPSGFLHSPQIGLLSSAIPLVETARLSSNVVISPHLINVRGTNLSVQRFMRGFTLGTADLAQIIYGVMPDAFDFLIHFSTYRLERLPYNASANFNSGVQRPVQVNFTGTGQGPFNNTGIYGSAGRLLSVIGLDGYERGIWSYNCAHEILHQWGSFLGALPISDGQHYNPRSSVGSLLGGHLWETNGAGDWTLICEEGRNGATRVAPLDKYLMGLLPAAQVPALRVYPQTEPLPLFRCDGTISNVQYVVTIGDITNRYGVRLPGPDTAKRHFSLGFVAESHQRLLTAVEMTFYDILAGHYTTPVRPGDPDPYVGFNWAPITRFFGEDTSWDSRVLSLIQPRINAVERVAGGTNRIRATGYPGRVYTLEASTNLLAWTTVASQVADTSGVCIFLDVAPAQPAWKFFRIK
jgi:hypothetical protein